MDDKEIKIQEILERYLAGHATEQEKAMLDSWYLQLEVKDRPQMQDSVRDRQLEEIWAGLPVHKKEPHNIYPWAWASVAALLVICSCLWLFRPDKTRTADDYTDNIKPGTKKAKLFLADGQSIDLNDEHVGSLAAQGSIQVMKVDSGTVSYSTAKETLGSGGKALYNIIETPAGGEYAVILPDGTHARLNASSTMKFPVSFSASERVVEVSGEVYFEVKRNVRKPFRVLSGKQQLEVLGTHFDVKAYPDDQEISTTLLEGSVKIAGPGGTRTLKPGQRAKLSGKVLDVEAVDASRAVSWVNGEFALKNEDFQTNMREIERWYNVKVVYDGEAPDSLKLGGWVSKYKPIEAVLGVMESTGKVKFRISGRELHVSR